MKLVYLSFLMQLLRLQPELQQAGLPTKLESQSAVVPHHHHPPLSGPGPCYDHLPGVHLLLA